MQHVILFHFVKVSALLELSNMQDFMHEFEVEISEPESNFKVVIDACGQEQLKRNIQHVSQPKVGQHWREQNVVFQLWECMVLAVHVEVKGPPKSKPRMILRNRTFNSSMQQVNMDDPFKKFEPPPTGGHN